MHSCLYEGWVQHQRRSPVSHGFRYRLSLLYLDLDEIERLPLARWLWSARRRAAVRFRREDHLGPPDQPLAAAIRELIVARGHVPAAGPIRLLTHPRYFGYVFNPVSFFFCYDQHERLQQVVAEVSNTPWGERHCYVLPAGQSNPPPPCEKQFHVSPFLPMELTYGWRFSAPGERLTVGLQSRRLGSSVLSVAMRLARRPLTNAGLVSSLVRYPLMTHRVWLAIYWQAVLLWSKGCPYFPHPQKSPPPKPQPSIPVS